MQTTYQSKLTLELDRIRISQVTVPDLANAAVFVIACRREALFCISFDNNTKTLIKTGFGEI